MPIASDSTSSAARDSSTSSKKPPSDQYERNATIASRSRARTSFFSPKLDRLYLAVPEHDGNDVELRVSQPQ